MDLIVDYHLQERLDYYYPPPPSSPEIKEHSSGAGVHPAVTYPKFMCLQVYSKQVGN